MCFLCIKIVDVTIFFILMIDFHIQTKFHYLTCKNSLKFQVFTAILAIFFKFKFFFNFLKLQDSMLFGKPVYNYIKNRYI